MEIEAPQKKQVWERTSVQCLLRNKQSGIHYARFTVSGKQKWISLETDVFSVAKLRLGDKKAEIEKQRGSAINVAAGKASMGDIITAYLARTRASPDFKPATITARETALKKLLKTWPGVEFLEPRQITPPSIYDWVSRFKGGHQLRPAGRQKGFKRQ